MFVDALPHVFHHWTDLYYYKAMEIYNLKNPLLKNKTIKTTKTTKRKKSRQ